jgi:hypothetical protein
MAKKPTRKQCNTPGCRRIARVAGRCLDHPHTKHEPGRPNKFNTHADLLITAIRTGLRPATARKQINISKSTVRRWIVAGLDAQALHDNGVPLNETEEMYRGFLERYYDACVHLQAQLEQRLQELAPVMEPREVLSVLERMDRETWGKHDTVTVQNGGDDQMVMQRWAETIGVVIKNVLRDCHLTEEQEELARVALGKHLLAVSVEHDDSNHDVEV